MALCVWLLFQSGDIIVSINGTVTAGMSHEQAIQLLKSSMHTVRLELTTGTILLLLLLPRSHGQILAYSFSDVGIMKKDWIEMSVGIIQAL